MQAGNLTSRIEIQHFTEVIDPDYGPQPGAWETFAYAWADMRHLSGLETVKQGIALAIVNASVRVRYVAGVTSAMRVVHKGRVYGIKAVLPDEQKKEFTDLICTTTGEQQ